MAEVEVRKVGEAREDASTSGNSKNPWIILIVVIVILAGLAFMFRDKLMSKPGDKTTTAMAKSSGYQAVFLTNGQVYFGKLSMSGQYANLKDIYYLQVTNPPQLQGAGSQASNSQQQPQIQLVKLGNELHGPVDSMQINQSQILFYEDMKEDGKVMQAIRTNQKTPQSTEQQGAAPVQTGTQTTPATQK